MDTLWQDVKYGARMMRKHRMLTLAAVLTLAVGIGANTAIFGLLHAVLLRPLPVPAPGRLAQLQVQYENGLDNSFNYPLYKDYRDRNTVFDGLIAFDGMPLHLTAGGQSDRVDGMIVSGNYFGVLGVRAAYGRTFLAEEDRTAGTHPVVVLGHGLWQRRFGADPGIVSKQILLNGRSFTVIGVAPREFTGTFAGSEAELYIPMAMYAVADPAREINPLNDRRMTWLMVMGRLKPGVSREQAQSAMRALAASLAETQPMNTDKNVVLTAASRGFTGLVEDLETPLKLLQVVVALVLLITCANVANLLMARSLARRREMAVRAALGAGRGRLLTQVLTESLLISIAGASAGLVLAPWITDALMSFRPFPGFAVSTPLDWQTLAFAAALAVASGVIFGLAPAWQSSNVSLIPALKEDAAAARMGRWNVRNLLVAGQLTISLAVLVAAGLCIESLRGLQAIRAGFDVERVLVSSLDVGRAGYNEARGREFYRQLSERVAALPGVEAAGYARVTPLGNSGMRITAQPEGHVSTREKPINLSMNVISAGWLRAMGIPLLRGRDFASTDTPTSPRVVIVNEALVSRYWPGTAGLGKQIELGGFGGSPGRQLQVVGVVPDNKYRSLTEPVPPLMYLPVEQEYQPLLRLFVRSSGSLASLAAPLRRIVAGLDANLPLYGTRTLAEQRDNSLYTARMAAFLLGVMSAIGLLLAAIGLYGVLAYAVQQRRREIGVRMALGAGRIEILRHILFQGMRPLLLGLVAGTAAALAGTRLISALLFGVGPQDPFVFVAATAVLAATAFVACWIPARRATRVDPMVALRYE